MEVGEVTFVSHVNLVLHCYNVIYLNEREMIDVSCH